jgi:hypothetical protein
VVLITVFVETGRNKNEFRTKRCGKDVLSHPQE